MTDGKGRILIVDDEKLQREIIILTLKKDGHELAEAASVREALSLLEKREFDLILTDLMMQGQTACLRTPGQAEIYCMLFSFHDHCQILPVRTDRLIL